jgi:hypothetical protein
MGYADTLIQIYYLDLTAHRVKYALSAKSDESGVGLGPQPQKHYNDVPLLMEITCLPLI